MAYGSYDKAFVSTISFMDKRETLNKVLDIHNEEQTFLDVMELFGNMKPTKAVTFNHFVNDELYATGIVTEPLTAETATNASPATVTMAGGTGMVRVGDQVLIPGANATVRTAIVKEVTSSTAIKVSTIDQGTLTIADNAVLSFFSGAYGEGSGYPTARKYSATPYSGQLQIFKDKFEISDVQWGAEVEVEFNGKPYVFKKAEYETALKFRADIANALILSEPTATTFDGSATITDVNGKTVSTTRGLDSWIVNRGGIEDTMSTTITLDDWKRLSSSLDAARSPKKYLILAGGSWNQKNDDLFLNLGGTASLTTTGAVFPAGKDVNLDLQTFTIYGRTYAKKPMDWFNHTSLIDYSGAPTIADCAYYMPLEKIKTQDGGMEDRIAVRYLVGENGYDSKFRTKVLNGLKEGDGSIEEDVIKVLYSATMGLQVLGTKHFVKQKIS